ECSLIGITKVRILGRLLLIEQNKTGGKANDGTHHKKPSNQGHCNRPLGTRLKQRSTFVAQTNLRTQT
ncbi:TPA: hypothetical protein ACQXDF_001553, partial [Streptococcus pneumoniae]